MLGLGLGVTFPRPTGGGEAPEVVASGGLERVYNGRKYHVFFADGTLTVTTGGEVRVTLLSGGTQGRGSTGSSGLGAGPGGAGGTVTEQTVTASAGAHAVKVGAGGQSNNLNGGVGAAGGDTSALGVTASGAPVNDAPLISPADSPPPENGEAGQGIDVGLPDLMRVGGGGGDGSSGLPPGTGTDGGGDGGRAFASAASKGTDATANTGGGGGGAGLVNNSAYQVGGSGAAGIAVISYPYSGA